jgi:hypothetical protein
LIVKIFLNSQEFSRKTNHGGAEGAQRMHEAALYSFLLRLGALEPKVRLWFKILQCFGKFQPLETKHRCPEAERIDLAKSPVFPLI